MSDVASKTTPKVKSYSLSENNARLAKIVLDLDKWRPGSDVQAKLWAGAMETLMRLLTICASDDGRTQGAPTVKRAG